jgi:hypothetical protein
MSQKFHARPGTEFEFANGAIGMGPGGPFDCLGPYAKVKNCPVEGFDIRVTAYASGYADTMFSVPANTRIRGKYVSGYFTLDDGAIRFVPFSRFVNIISDLLNPIK